MSRIPFSNGTEVEAWQARWCDYCVHDHWMHTGGMDATDGYGCEVAMFAHFPDDMPWPEVWAAAPDFHSHLPARIACLMFQPCTKGECDGDPGADERPAYIAAIEADMRAGRAEGETT